MYETHFVVLWLVPREKNGGAGEAKRCAPRQMRTCRLVQRSPIFRTSALESVGGLGKEDDSLDAKDQVLEDEDQERSLFSCLPDHVAASATISADSSISFQVIIPDT
jgi:hypothetical protein